MTKVKFYKLTLINPLNPDMLANIILSFMVMCQFRGPMFINKMLHVKQLDSKFLYTETKITE